jgi:hypothetical protein
VQASVEHADGSLGAGAAAAVDDLTAHQQEVDRLWTRAGCVHRPMLSRW